MQVPRDKCPICWLHNQPMGPGLTSLSFAVKCERCGQFYWDVIGGVIPDGATDLQVRLSGYCHEQNAAGIDPILTKKLIDRIERMPLPSLTERANWLLRYLGSTNHKYMSNVRPTVFLAAKGVSYSASNEDVLLLCAILEERELLKPVPGGESSFAITPKGYVFLDELGRTTTVSSQAFVAMSFDPSMGLAFEHGFDPGIRAAGYKPLRIKDKEHVNGISDEIMLEIRRSRLLIADYTLSNNGVYFEAGFAMGLGLTVIPTCREDNVGKLHFDIRHLNTLLWTEPADLVEGLAKRIAAVCGEGPHIQSS